MNQRILVLGSGDVGSAVAHRLFLSGADVVLADEPAPAHPRRGMAFTDAWFDGTATLEGVVAQMVSDVADLADQCTVIDAILCADSSLVALVTAWRPDTLIDARMRKRAVPEDLRPQVPRVIGLGPGFTPGRNCSAAIETTWGDELGALLLEQAASPLAGEPRALGGVGRERFVYAPQGGVWCTAARMGDRVAGGAEVGLVHGAEGTIRVSAPLTGALRGLSHDGVNVRAGQKLLEVDPRPEPDTHGLGARPAAIARGVARALGLHTDLDSAFFRFEASYRQTLDCIPMSMRRKLDLCGFKLSLAQWRGLPRTVREALVEAPVSSRQVQRLRAFLRRRAQHEGWPDAAADCAAAAADQPEHMPEAVLERCGAQAPCDPLQARWAALTPLQRYTLTQLAQQRSGRNWPEALAEFGFIAPAGGAAAADAGR